MAEEGQEMQDMLNVDPFLEGQERQEIPIEKEIENQESDIDDKSKSYLDNLNTIFNEGIEKEEEKFTFDENVIKGKKEDGTEYTIEEKKQHVIDKILDKTLLGASKEVDTYVREIIAKSREEGFNIEEYKKGENQEQEIDMSDMNTIVKKVYTVRYGEGTDAGLTNDEIDEKLKTISDADKKLLVADFKQAMQKVQQQKREEEFNKQELMFDEQVKKYNSDTDNAIKVFAEQSKTKDVFAGFKFGQSDKEEYLKDIPEFMKRVKSKTENGDVYAISSAEKELQNIIKDPKSILELIPFLWLKSKGKLDGYSTMLSEKVKWDMIERLDSDKSKEYNNPNGSEKDLSEMVNVESYLG